MHRAAPTLVLSLMLSASLAVAGEPPPAVIRLDFQRDPAAARACPDEQEFRDAMTAHVRRPLFDPAAADVLVVRLQSRSDGYQGVAELRGPTGVAAWTLPLGPVPRDCSAVADNLALSVAIKLDPRGGKRAAPSLLPNPHRLFGVDGESLPSPPTPGLAPDATTPPSRAPEPEPEYRVRLGATGGVAIAAAPGWGPSFAVDVGLRWRDRPLSLALEAGFMPPAGGDLTSGTNAVHVTTYRGTGAAVACGHFARFLFACGVPEGRALLEQMQRIFVEVLQEIDGDQRMVYLMSVKDEIPIPEIAELLGVPENTVRSRLHRARQAIDAGVARRQTKAGSALAPLLVPAALVDAARKGFDVDPAVQAVVWSRLARLLGLGIIGALAPASGAAIAGGAALLLALGAGSGALLHATVARPRATETTVRAESAAPSAPPASPGTLPDMTASTGSTATAAPAASASTIVSVAGLDAGAPDAAALLRAEGAILARAREAMDREQWQTALRELQRHARSFPHGRLAAGREEMMRVVVAEIRRRDGGPR